MLKLFKKGRIPWNKGVKMSADMKLRISNTLKKKGIKPSVHFSASGDKHPFWKGDNVSYSGLHYWLRRKLGEPKVCEFCGTDKKRLTWANKSWKYRRTLDDWISLCYSCHKKYDLKRRCCQIDIL